MKKTIVLAAACCFVAIAYAATPGNSNDQVAQRILEVYPQADTNGDGVLSKAELTAVGRLALKRYPQADADGDGKLSPQERDALLEKLGKTNSPPQATNPTTPKNVDANQTEDSVRQGPRMVQPGVHGVGKQIPNLTFTDITGQQHKLSDFSDHKAVVFAMTGTGCPLCLKYAPSLAQIEQQYRGRNVAFIFINPNESESLARIQGAVAKHEFKGAYVKDPAKHLPSALGAKTTTEVFVLDKARTLVYRGAVDDQNGFAYALETPRTRFLTDALDAVLDGQTPDVQATSSPGCELFYDQTIQNQTTVTYHNRISRIIQANCIECHRGDGIAPISFDTYEEVKDYASMIGNVVRRGVMPPWFAAPQSQDAKQSEHVLHWANDRSLSDAEKSDLFSWIKAGAPEGDSADAPLPKTFPDGWLIGKPDVVFEFARPVSVKATGIMPYKHITVETNLPEDKWVQAIEVRPGKLDVVHHVIVSVRAGEGEFDERDGYWGAYVPGNSTLVYPDGYARRLPKGAKLRFQMHYTPNGEATEDSTRIGLVYSKTTPKHEVKVAGIASSRISIPPHADNHSEVAELRLPYDVQVLSFLPHMHLRGKAARYEALTADGTTTLLDIPRYDFNWQLLYQLSEPLTLRQGDSIRFTGWFDNSKNNPANPDPNKRVRWGQQTEDEMHLGYVEYIVPGVKAGEPISSMRSGRGGRRINLGTGEARIGGQRIVRDSLLRAIRQLDKNNDGKLTKDEVPSNRLRLFGLLDANGDEVLTTEEVNEAVQKRNASSP